MVSRAIEGRIRLHFVDDESYIEKERKKKKGGGGRGSINIAYCVSKLEVLK
jgi:hypothetical protein